MLHTSEELRSRCQCPLMSLGASAAGAESGEKRETFDKKVRKEIRRKPNVPICSGGGSETCEPLKGLPL